MTEEQKKKLEQKLWDIANTLRGKMDADEFRDYILGFIFYKYLSERMHSYATRILGQDNIEFTTIDETTPQGQEFLDAIRDASVEALGYFLKPSELFSAVAKRGEQGGFILGDLATILSNIERSTMGTDSEQDFDHLFEDLDLTSTKLGRTEEAKNALISKVLTHLDAIDFRLDDAKADVLGDAYEYLIGQFASGAGKKAGEFYTPQQVSTILARIVTTGKTRLKSVYDPTCGSGSLLLRVAREVSDVADFFGQEMNRTTYNLARMNMILHGVHYRNFDLKQEDTLEHPQHEGMQFEAIVANPPFSAKWSARPLFLQDDRFAQYGKLAPSSKADYAFVTHMLAHLDDNGAMAVVLPHGALFRGGAEGVIREYIIREKNWLDAIIGLPANIFYGTTIPTCIMVFKKCRETDDVLFVDASTCFEKGKNENRLRPEDVDRIVNAYRSRAVEEKFSHRASMKEIAGNDYNLNLTRYVDSFEEESPVDLAAVATFAKNANSVNEAAEKAIETSLSQLDVKFPVTSNLYALEKLKHGLMQSLFSQQLRFKRNDGESFPDWDLKLFGHLVTWHRNNNLSREYVGEREGRIQNIHYGDIHGRFLGLFRQSEAAAPFISANAPIGTIRDDDYCRPGDIVVADASEDYADIGKAIEIIEASPKSLVAGLHTHLARPKPGVFALGYAGYMLRSSNVRRQVMRQAQGISVLGISKDNLGRVSVPVPCFDEQQKIAGLLSALDEKISAVSGRIGSLEVSRVEPLHQMFV